MYKPDEISLTVSRKELTSHVRHNSNATSFKLKNASQLYPSLNSNSNHSSHSSSTNSTPLPQSTFSPASRPITLQRTTTKVLQSMGYNPLSLSSHEDEEEKKRMEAIEKFAQRQAAAAAIKAGITPIIPPINITTASTTTTDPSTLTSSAQPNNASDSTAPVPPSLQHVLSRSHYRHQPNPSLSSLSQHSSGDWDVNALDDDVKLGLLRRLHTVDRQTIANLNIVANDAAKATEDALATLDWSFKPIGPGGTTQVRRLRASVDYNAKPFQHSRVPTMDARAEHLPDVFQQMLEANEELKAAWKQLHSEDERQEQQKETEADKERKSKQQQEEGESNMWGESDSHSSPQLDVRTSLGSSIGGLTSYADDTESQRTYSSHSREADEQEEANGDEHQVDEQNEDENETDRQAISLEKHLLEIEAEEAKEDIADLPTSSPFHSPVLAPSLPSPRHPPVMNKDSSLSHSQLYRELSHLRRQDSGLTSIQRHAELQDYDAVVQEELETASLRHETIQDDEEDEEEEAGDNPPRIYQDTSRTISLTSQPSFGSSIASSYAPYGTSSHPLSVPRSSSCASSSPNKPLKYSLALLTHCERSHEFRQLVEDDDQQLIEEEKRIPTATTLYKAFSQPLTARQTYSQDEYTRLQRTGLLPYMNRCAELNIPPNSKISTQLEGSVMNLNHFGIGESMADALSAALMVNSSVTVLDLEDNFLSARGLSCICTALHEQNATIKFLDLSHNSLDIDGISAIGAMLRYNQTLVELHICRNNLSDRSVIILTECLNENETLTRLDLSSNSISDKGCKALQQYLSKIPSPTLRYLDLSWNCIRDTGGTYLAKSLQYNTNLLVLLLAWNGCGEQTGLTFANVLATNSTLHRLDLSNNRLNGIVFRKLYSSLKENTSLKQINLSNNQLPAKDAALWQSLLVLKAIEGVDIQLTGLSELVSQAESIATQAQIEAKRTQQYQQHLKHVEKQLEKEATLKAEAIALEERQRQQNGNYSKQPIQLNALIVSPSSKHHTPRKSPVAHSPKSAPMKSSSTNSIRPAVIGMSPAHSKPSAVDVSSESPTNSSSSPLPPLSHRQVLAKQQANVRKAKITNAPQQRG